MKMLDEIGITVPDVVHGISIDPRNKSEHDYKEVDERTASHAVGVAELFLSSTKEEANRGAVIALNWNLAWRTIPNREGGTVGDFHNRPMLLVDIFETPHLDFCQS